MWIFGTETAHAGRGVNRMNECIASSLAVPAATSGADLSVGAGAILIFSPANWSFFAGNEFVQPAVW